MSGVGGGSVLEGTSVIYIPAPGHLLDNEAVRGEERSEAGR